MSIMFIVVAVLLLVYCFVPGLYLAFAKKTLNGEGISRGERIIGVILIIAGTALAWLNFSLMS